MNVLPLAFGVSAFVALLLAKRAPPTTPATGEGGEETVETFDAEMGLNGRPMLYARVGQDGSDT